MMKMNIIIVFIHLNLNKITMTFYQNFTKALEVLITAIIIIIIQKTLNKDNNNWFNKILQKPLKC